MSKLKIRIVFMSSFLLIRYCACRAGAGGAFGDDYNCKPIRSILKMATDVKRING